MPDQTTVVTIDRWSFYTGGPSIQVVLLHRWSFYTGGPSTQVVLLHGWSFYTGSPSTQGVLLHRESFYTGGPSTWVVLLHGWSFYTGGPSIQVVLQRRWSFYTGGLFTQVVLLHRGFFYTGGPFTQVVFLRRWSFYTGGSSTQVVLLRRWSFYTGGPSTQVFFRTDIFVHAVACLLPRICTKQAPTVVEVVEISNSVHLNVLSPHTDMCRHSASGCYVDTVSALLQSTYVMHLAENFSSKDLIRLIVEIYDGIPGPYEVYHCRPDSTEEELTLFFQRARRFL